MSNSIGTPPSVPKSTPSAHLYEPASASGALDAPEMGAEELKQIEFRKAHPELEATVQLINQLFDEWALKPGAMSVLDKFTILPAADMTLIRENGLAYPEWDLNRFMNPGSVTPVATVPAHRTRV